MELHPELVVALLVLGVTNLFGFVVLFTKVVQRQEHLTEKVSDIAEDVRIIAEHSIKIEVLKNQVDELRVRVDKIGQ